MMIDDFKLRWAQEDDVPQVADILRSVSDGATDYLLNGVVPGLDARSVMELVLRRGMKPYSLNQILLADVGGKLAGLLFAYDADEQVIPIVMKGFVPNERLKALQPLLEAKWPKSLWVNTFWVSEDHRGEGLSQLLMNVAEDLARSTGFKSIALHCWSDNARAQAFYKKAGFEKKTAVPTGGSLLERHPDGGDIWVKALSQDAKAE